MNVSLTTELEQFVEEKVKGGDYTSASEVVRAGLRLLKEREAEHQARLEALRRDVREGLGQLEHGEGVSGAAAFARVRAGREQRKVRKRA
ncbi:MAG: type II toxin-antitoxin system ParD family antitoxin [Gemmatimonadaceae bacterium]